MQELIQEFTNFDETEFDESASGDRHGVEDKAVENKHGLEDQTARESGPDMKRVGGWGLREAFDRRKLDSTLGGSDDRQTVGSKV